MYSELALLLPFVFLIKMKFKTRLILFGVTLLTCGIIVGFHIGRVSLEQELDHGHWEGEVPRGRSKFRARANDINLEKRRVMWREVKDGDYLDVIELGGGKEQIMKEANELLAKRGGEMGGMEDLKLEGVGQERNKEEHVGEQVQMLHKKVFPAPISLKPRKDAQKPKPAIQAPEIKQDLQNNIQNGAAVENHAPAQVHPPAQLPANQNQRPHPPAQLPANQNQRLHLPAQLPAIQNQQQLPAGQKSANQQKGIQARRPGVHYAGEPIEILPEPEPLETVGTEPVADVFGKTLLPLRECIHLSVVVCGDRTEETLIMLKSASVLSQTCLVFHVFAEDELQEGIRDKLNLWPDSVRSRITLYVYPITFPSSENKQEWKKVFKLCATQRLFLPDLLPVVDSLLYIDTDILFIRPVERIWQFFNRFNSSQLAALTPEHEVPSIGWYNRFARHPYYGKTGLNSGVMLMNLTRMREFKWTKRIIPFYRQYRYKITWGDQDLINVVFYFHPDKVFEYPCEWNYRPDHCMYGNNCGRIESEGIAVIHGNRGVYHNEKQLPFKSIYETYRDFQFGSSILTGLVQPLKEKWMNTNIMGMYCTKAMRKPLLSTLSRYT